MVTAFSFTDLPTRFCAGAHCTGSVLHASLMFLVAFVSFALPVSLSEDSTPININTLKSSELLYCAVLGEGPPGFGKTNTKEAPSVEAVGKPQQDEDLPFKEEELRIADEVFSEVTNSPTPPERPTLKRDQTGIIVDEEPVLDLDSMSYSTMIALICFCFSLQM